MAEELLGTEIGLAFIIIGILLFLVEATMPGFLVAVPGTVLIALGILMSFDIVTGIWLLPIGLVVGLGSLFGTVKFYQTFATPDAPSEMSIESYVGTTGRMTRAISSDSIYGKVRIDREEMRAISDSDIAIGTNVEVISAEGITLTVEPKE
ncbi:MAG: NfeD family protein [Candidatus Thermoplasmatota archaeon]|nr:NfeD family protein [Candidatus Thermoplasmatota archaeon]MEC9333272.1 NfeD family protein [Candidatus Thermoplasmatota archaeon]MED6306062.1 NfeD family protein [Candidatus Thermoplasmatota archaeon]